MRNTIGPLALGRGAVAAMMILAGAVAPAWAQEQRVISVTGEASVEAAPDTSPHDIVALGFWLQAGKPDPKTAAYLARVQDTRLFLFATHGAAVGSAHVRSAMDHASSLAPEASVIGSFGCQGEVNPKVLEKIRAKVPPPPWIRDADGAVGHPDQEDLATLEATLKALNLG